VRPVPQGTGRITRFGRRCNTVAGVDLRLSERQVATALSGRDAASRVELAELTGLPRTTAVAAVASLLRRGVLVERDDPHEGPRPVGRPASVVSLADPRGPVAVIAFGHTDSNVAVCDYTGTVLARQSLQVSTSDPMDAVKSALAELSGGPPSVAVVGIPYPLDREHGVPVSARHTPSATFPNLQPLPAWLRTDPSAAFSAALHVPVVAENDANLAALGEALFGAGRRRRGVVHVSIKDGIGAGLVLDGRLHRGTTGFAGELAHVSVRDDGRLCVCGGRGCLATVYRNGPQLIDEIQTAYGRPLTFEDMQALAAQGDVGVRRILADLGRTVGRPLADLAVLLNPDTIIVDGALGDAAPPVVDGMREALERHTPPMISRAVEVLPGTLGGDAQYAGAVALARQRHYDDLLGGTAVERG
jgi:predicted NBD/HSP70 family sugar kinase